MPFKKGEPAHPRAGRPKGSPNKATLEIKEFARGLLESTEYREELRARLIDGRLSPQVEVMLHHYAYGVPKQPVEIDGELNLFGVLAVPEGQDADKWASRAAEQQAR